MGEKIIPATKVYNICIEDKAILVAREIKHFFTAKPICSNNC